MNNPTVLLTVEELASLLKVSPHTIYYWVNRSEVPYLKVGKHLRFDQDEVLRHFQGATRSAKQPACLPPIAVLESPSSNWSLKTERGSCLPTKGVSNGH
jgi:excisionase family DNA binding protein